MKLECVFVKVMREEVGPKLEQMREERALYDEYRQLEKESEHLARLYHAWQYHIARKNTVVSKAALEEGQVKIQEIKDEIEKRREAIKETEVEIEEASQRAKEVSVILPSCFFLQVLLYSG